MAEGQPPSRTVVLVIEDEPIQRMMAVETVEEAGFEAVEAMGSDDAVRVLEQRFDIRIVFSDIDMPGGMDGLKLAAAIRDRWPPIEFIITSGKRQLRLDDLPARGVFFPKPYKRHEVVEVLQRMAG